MWRGPSPIPRRILSRLTPTHLQKKGRMEGVHRCCFQQQQPSWKTAGIKCLSTVPITYVEADGTEKEVEAEVGESLLDVAHKNHIELEGACGGELACSTCHLIFEQDIYDTLPEKDEEEDDMLDLAFEVTDTSRLGCQIPVKENFAGMKVQIPDDGF